MFLVSTSLRCRRQAPFVQPAHLRPTSRHWPHRAFQGITFWRTRCRRFGGADIALLGMNGGRLMPMCRCNIVTVRGSPSSGFRRMVDFRLLPLLIVCIACLHVPDAHSKTQIYKCVRNGTVTLQQQPCAVNQDAQRPTVQHVNEARKKRVHSADGPANSAAPGPQSQEGGALAPLVGTPIAPVQPGVTGQYRCDGRQYCSQMTSCSEARYFLAQCPDVKMDGNGDGVPCEKQWCRR